VTKPLSIATIYKRIKTALPSDFNFVIFRDDQKFYAAIDEPLK
jgi:hypothetical protein